MKECDGNQQLENMSATQTQKRIGDFFSVEILPNKRKRSNRVKPMMKNNQLMEKLGNRRKKKKNQTDWLQKPQFHWLRYDHAKLLMAYSICIQKTNAMTLGTDNSRIIQ